MDPRSIVHERATGTLMLWRCLQQTLGRIVTCSDATGDKMWFTRLSKISRLLPAEKWEWGRDRGRNAQKGLTEMTKNYSTSQMSEWTTSVPRRELKLEKEFRGKGKWSRFKRCDVRWTRLMGKSEKQRLKERRVWRDDGVSRRGPFSQPLTVGCCVTFTSQWKLPSFFP